MFKSGKKLISMVVVLAFLMSMFSFSVSAESTNLAAGKTVTASSFDSAGLEGSKVVDGVIDASHEWYSYGDTNEWVRINLGSAQSFNQVKVYWGTGYAAGYKLQGSSNGTSFTDISGATITNGTGGTETINFTAVSYQYIRLYTTTVPTGNYGHEIMELEVYGGTQTVPSTPTGLTAAAASSSAINTGWDVVSGTIGYKLYRVGTTAAIYTGTATSYTDTGLSTNTQYSYQVTAYNAAGESSKSSSVSATTQNPQTGTNIAAGKSFTSSTTYTGASYVTDGDSSTSSNYADLAGADVQWIQFDLGEGAVTSSVKLWHYYANARTYNDVIVQLSNDSSFATGVTTVFNNDTNNSTGRGTGTDAAYAESSTGKTITVNNVTAQYIRFYTNGSSSNAHNHYVEVQVLGTAGQPSIPNNEYVHLNNHVYFDKSQDGLTDAQIKEDLDDIAQSKYQMKYLLIRTCGLDTNGNPEASDVANYGNVGHWIKIARQYYPDFKLIGVINLEQAPTTINNGGTPHTNIVNFAKMACGINSQGFEYDGVNYYCDGVQLDAEPTYGIDPDQFNSLFASIRTAIGSSKHIGVACSGDSVNKSITNNTYNTYQGIDNKNWDFDKLTTMAKYVDTFAVMAYDQCSKGSGVTSEATYRTYCKNLAIYYAEAVNAQTDRSRTNNPLLVQLTTPMYRTNGTHDPSIETQGILDAIDVNTTAALRCDSAGVFYGGYLFGWQTNVEQPYSATQLQDWWENCWLKGNINY